MISPEDQQLGVKIMSSVVLDVPAKTFNGLREQAKSLEIPGRGRMNKAELYAAVQERFDALRAREAGKRDLLASMGLDDGEPVAPDTVRMEVNLDSLNASLVRTGKHITVTPAHVAAAGMVPVNSKARDVATAILAGDEASLDAMLAERVERDTRPPVKVPDYSAVAAVKVPMLPAKSGPSLPAVPHGAVVALNDVPWTVHAPMEADPEVRSPHAMLVTTSYGRVLSTRDLKRLESCGLAPGESVVDVHLLASTGGTRENGRKGTGLLMTREGRKTYPAGKATRARRGGRK